MTKIQTQALPSIAGRWPVYFRCTQKPTIAIAKRLLAFADEVIE